MLDIQRTITLLQDALLTDLGDEVDLIFRYGSTLKGTTHTYSDLDISYVPAHEDTWKSITVLVGDIMVDLYPIHWSQLERMANFDDVRGTVLLTNHIVYRRSEQVAARFHALGARLRALHQAEARPHMVRKAHEHFQRAGYPSYLLRQQAAIGHLLACRQHAHQIVATIFHALAVCNQASIDTRKVAEVLALPKLPLNFDALLDRITQANAPGELLACCDQLLDATRALLLAEQQQLSRGPQSFAAVFASAYPEFKGGLQHAMLACERQDLFALQENLLIIYHELMVHLAQAATGIEYSGFNTIADYEQALALLGFPDLWPYVVAQDYAALHRQCQAFDQRLQEFLTQRAVALNAFANLDELQQHLGQ